MKHISATYTCDICGKTMSCCEERHSEVGGSFRESIYLNEEETIELLLTITRGVDTLQRPIHDAHQECRRDMMVFILEKLNKKYGIR